MNQDRAKSALAQLQARYAKAVSKIDAYEREVNKIKQDGHIEFCRQQLLLCEKEVKDMQQREKSLLKQNSQLIAKVKKSNHELEDLSQHFQRLQAIKFFTV